MAQDVFSGTFPDVNDFPGIIKSSNLLLRHPKTFVDVVEGLEVARRVNRAINHFRDVPEPMILAQNRVCWHVSGRKTLSRDS